MVKGTVGSVGVSGNRFMATPAVSMLKAFAPGGDMGAPELTYPNLEAVAATARQKENTLLREVWEAPEGSLDEEKAVRSASIGYFVLTGNQLQQTAPDNRHLVSSRFTQSSIELYGAPQPAEVSKLLIGQYTDFSRYKDHSNVDQGRLDAVTNVLEGAFGASIEGVQAPEDKHLQIACAEINRVLRSRYEASFQLFDAIEERGLKPSISEVQAIFEKSTELLVPIDNSWSAWQVKVTDGIGMSVSADAKTINIGRHGDYQHDRLRPLFAHEVLTHALRAINGLRTGDKLLYKGLPGNLDAEEGLSILKEYAVSGVLPDKVTDRYIDVSLALGQMHLPAMTRAQLHAFHTNRKIVRAQAAHKPADAQEQAKAARNHVNRIYRGSLGNEVIGVNTKDISYYQGFVEVAPYMVKEIVHNRRPAEQVIDYVMSCCINPTDARHRGYAEDRAGIVLPPLT